MLRHLFLQKLAARERLVELDDRDVIGKLGEKEAFFQTAVASPNHD